MEQIDRLGWAAGFSFRAYGCAIGIRVSDAALLERVHAALPYGWKPSANPDVERLYSLLYGGDGTSPSIRRFHLLYGNWTRLCRTLHLDEAFTALASDLRRFVAQSARTRVFLHAGSVVWKGRAILLLDPEDTAKAALLAELARAGARSYSDDLAAIDARGRVHPCPPPIALRPDGQERGGHPAVSPDGRYSRTPLPVGLVVIGRYEEDAPWQPHSLTAHEAIQALATAAATGDRGQEMVRRAVEQITAGAPVLEGAWGDAREAARRILATAM